MFRHMISLLLVLVVALAALSGCGGSAPALEVTLQAPGNGETATSHTPILSWTSTVSDALYRVQVATDTSFQNLVMDEANLVSPSYTVPSGKLADDSSYYWRVNASRDNETSGWASYWTFQTPSGAATTGTIVVIATLDGASWSGDVSYTITGPQSDTGSTVSHSFGDLPAGAYTLGYSSGGPAEATLVGIEPSATLTLSSGGTVTYTLNFNKQPADTIVVGATLNGSPWSGKVTYTLHGPQDYSGTSVSQTFSNLSDGTYTLSYKAGGPSGATLSSITPQPTRTLSSGSTATFTLNFHSGATGTIVVYATLDGISWSGAVNYSIHGPTSYSGSAASQNFGGLPTGSYTVTYRYGGPTGATLSNITPQPTQTLSAGGTIEFNLNFHSQTTGTIKVNATINGPSWSGAIDYTLHGPYTDYHSAVPHTFGSLPAGTYTLVYHSGGPPGALLSGISPSATQTLSFGGTLTFTLSFYTPPPPPAVGTIKVNATLDGSSWQTAVGSQPISYSIHGQKSDSSTEVPYTFSGYPGGAYTLSYTSGGPAGAVLSNITPAPSQYLATGHTIVFTMNFHSQAAGTVNVNATLNGEEWEGDVEYYVHGPYMNTSSSVPDSFSSCPAGTYTITYKSGGPPQSVLDSISPSPTQGLSSGDTITFTLNFVFQGGIITPLTHE